MNLDFTLHDAQMQIFQSEARFKVAVAGRRFGKSFLACVTLLIEALRDTNNYGMDVTDKEVWYVAPTFQQAKDIMWGLLKRLGADVIESTIENTATARLFNGRRIQLKGSDRPDTLRGSGLSYVVLDEYADMRPIVWEEIISPALTEAKGGALFIGTPKGKNHFYDLYLQAASGVDGQWEAWHFNTTDNPIIDGAEVEKRRALMSAHAFRQEFEANFAATGGGVFQEDMIILDNSEPKEGSWYIAVDPAGYGDTKELSKGKIKRLDEMAIAIVKVGPHGWWVKEIDAGRWDIREASLRILRHAKRIQPVCIGIEAGSLKNAIMPYLEDNMRRLGVFPRIQPVTHGGKKKTERIAWSLQGRFEHGKIQLAKGPWTNKFIDQMLDFPNPLSHDDMLDALAYIDQVAITNYNNNLDIDEWEPLDSDSGF